MQQSEAQALGRKGECWFQNQLPKHWIFQRPSEDIGIDGVVVIAEPGELNGAEFRVQVKSSRKWPVQEDRLLLRARRASVQQWIAGLSPGMLVLYEEDTDMGFYLVGASTSLQISRTSLRRSPRRSRSAFHVPVRLQHLAGTRLESTYTNTMTAFIPSR